ncbi:MAG: hypothetical protein ACRECX_12535 [Methyloceanibacter sp.]|uniref:hypothetical protein n=1 Tax=Methyloceanibacter sp. TaxID=1965321 RepID=UPI003D6CEEF6
MRVAVGSDVSRDSRQAELDRHLEAMSLFVERASGQECGARRCTMILRAADSAPARALIAMKDTLVGARVGAQAILAKLEPQDDLRQLFAALSELSPEEPASRLIRWARNPRLLNAHEQATYGSSMCWSGDAMRRDADKRNPLVLFDLESADAAELARLSFQALWGVSAPVPARHLVARAHAKPSGAYEQAPEAPVAALRRSFQGWPLVRH